jgi:hypothetical protein
VLRSKGAVLKVEEHATKLPLNARARKSFFMYNSLSFMAFKDIAGAIQIIHKN